jgi:PLP dependent protein
VLAVTKGFGSDAVAAAVSAGLTQVGENYAQELVAKAADPCAASAQFHFLGAIQRNKVRHLAPVVSCWQSVTRAVEGEAIAKAHPGATVLVQIDTGSAPGRNGCVPDQAPALVRSLGADGLQVAGLMTVAPLDGGPDMARASFALVRQMADELGLGVRSMGMSDDLEQAVAEGTTMVRIGRGLFGPRPPRAASS